MSGLKNTMTRDELSALLNLGESQVLEWKSDWPQELLGNSRDDVWNQGKGTLLKDLCATANAGQLATRVAGSSRQIRSAQPGLMTEMGPS